MRPKNLCADKTYNSLSTAGYLFGRKFFEVGLLELTGSVVTSYEIHAYDGHTLGLIVVLLEYLQKLDA